MTRSRWAFGLLVAVPALALAAVGATHPDHLTFRSAEHWWQMHVVALPLFLLVGLALAALVGGRRDPVAWLVRLLAFGFAAFYTALDVLAGIGAGYVTARGGLDPLPGSPAAVRSLFAIGNELSVVGVWALLVGCLAVAVDSVRRRGLAAVPPSLLLVAASVSFLDSHIYRWRGVVTVALLGLAMGWLGMLRAGGVRDRDRTASAS